MSTLYIAGNYVNVSTLLSVTSEDTVYKKEWMYDRRQSKPFRFTAKSGNQILIDGGAGKISPTIAAIMNHNLAGTIGGGAFLCKIKADDSNPPGGGWDAPTYSRDITWHTLNMFKLLDGAPTYRYWLLDIDDFDNPLTGCEIGEFVLHIYGAFPRPFQFPHESSYEKLIFDNETPYGQKWRAKKGERERFNVDFSGATDSNISTIKTFIDDMDGIFPFIFIPNNAGTDCWYIDAVPIFAKKAAFYNYNSFSFEFIEQTRGITLL